MSESKSVITDAYSVMNYILASAGQQQPRFDIPEEISFNVIRVASQLFDAEPAVLQIQGSFAAIGDLHGNLDCLLRILESFESPSSQPLLFLGDYVDRGHKSVEVILMLFSLKVLFPRHVYLIRGNHESRSMTVMYGFLRECQEKCTRAFYDAVMDAFAKLPIAAILNQKIFCVHGGISPSVSSREELLILAKPVDDVTEAPVSDFIWSDPNRFVCGFLNSDRGCGYQFGEDVLNAFLRKIHCSLLVRSHESCSDGFSYPFGQTGHIMTIFSSCDYGGMGNDAGAIIFGEDCSADLQTFHPLSKEELKRRRIIYPPYVIEKEKTPVIEAQFPVCPHNEMILASLPESPIEV